MNHTKEPWITWGGAIWGHYDSEMAIEILVPTSNEPYIGYKEAEANVDRAITCVNFCAGLVNLPAVVAHLDEEDHYTLPPEETLVGLIDELIEFVGLVPGEVYHDPRVFVDTMWRRWIEAGASAQRHTEAFAAIPFAPVAPPDENALLSQYEAKIADEEAASVLDPQHAYIGSHDAYLTEPTGKTHCPTCDSTNIVIYEYYDQCQDCGTRFA